MVTESFSFWSPTLANVEILIIIQSLKHAGNGHPINLNSLRILNSSIVIDTLRIRSSLHNRAAHNPSGLAEILKLRYFPYRHLLERKS